MRKVSALYPLPQSRRIDLSYVHGGVIDNVSGTKIVADGDKVTLVAGSSKTMTREQAHTLFYAFLLLTGWDEDNKRTL